MWGEGGLVSPHLGEGWACGFDASSFLFVCELSAGHACPYSVHVCWGELEGVVEAFGCDLAVFADLACACDVGDVFVFFGEHLVGFVFAVGLVEPGCFGFIVVWWGWGVLFCHFFRVLGWGGCDGRRVGFGVIPV